MKKIITTVGTSLITNYDKDSKSDISKEIKDELYSEYDEFKDEINEIKEKLSGYLNKNRNDACAEITSINKLKEKYPNEEFEIYLISTDTLESVVVAEVLREFFKNKAEILVIDNLRIEKNINFEIGIKNLIDEIYKTIINNKNIPLKSNEVIFNITGGYKGVVPYISTIAQIFGYEIIYTFEDKELQKELIEIKSLPIEISRGLLELYYPYLENIKLIENNQKIKQELEDKGLVENNDLTPLGKMALLTVKNTPLSKDVFGHFVEYKVYEYFINNFFDKNFESNCLNFEYQNVGHGVSLGKNLTDIDIMLERDNEIIWIEVKPISYLVDKNNRKKLIKQIRDKQLGRWSESKFKDKNLKKYLLIIYLYDKDILTLVTKEIKDEFKNLFNEVDFDICYIELNLTKSDKKEQTITSSTYQTIMKDFQIKQLKRMENV